MTTRPFLVAGGGIAGLSAALGLASAGRDVRLFEQAPAFEEVGAGLQMSPNGVRALRALGAWEAVEPACVIPSEIHVRDGQSGGLLQRIRLGKPFEERFGAPYRVCHRADLLAGLLATAKASACVSLATAHRVTRIDTTGNEVTLGFASGQTEAGDAAIGADGIRSTLRQAVCGDVVPSPSGHAIYRGLLPLANVPADIEADSVTLWLCRGGHVVHYPVSNWRSFNIVAAADADAADAGWGKEAGGSDVLARFRDCADMLAGLLAAPVSWFGWQGADLPSCRPGRKVRFCSWAMPPTPPCPIWPRAQSWPSRMPQSCRGNSRRVTGRPKSLRAWLRSAVRAPCAFRRSPAGWAKSIMPAGRSRWRATRP